MTCKLQEIHQREGALQKALDSVNRDIKAPSAARILKPSGKKLRLDSSSQELLRFLGLHYRRICRHK